MEDHCDGAGSCVYEGMLICDDGLLCTVDACDSLSGCVAAPNDGLCDDGSACTVDTCVVGSGCMNAPRPTWYLDADGDGYGDPGTAICAETQPAGSYVAAGGDCCDTSASTHPGQTTFYAKANACGSFDYDCSGSQEPESAAIGSCGGGCIGRPGWYGGLPPCGGTGTWFGSCSWSLSGCKVNTSPAVLYCR